jgi:hypothetical protein
VVVRVRLPAAVLRHYLQPSPGRAVAGRFLAAPVRRETLVPAEFVLASGQAADLVELPVQVDPGDMAQGLFNIATPPTALSPSSCSPWPPSPWSSPPTSSCNRSAGVTNTLDWTRRQPQKRQPRSRRTSPRFRRSSRPACPPRRAWHGDRGRTVPDLTRTWHRVWPATGRTQPDLLENVRRPCPDPSPTYTSERDRSRRQTRLWAGPYPGRRSRASSAPPSGMGADYSPSSGPRTKAPPVATATA